MRKGLFYLAVLICLVIGALAVNQHLLGDRKGPEIRFGKEILYYAGMADEELMDGVSAYDEVDGDVSDSLIIERIIPNRSDDTAVVIYAARDYNNNVVRERRILDFVEETTEAPTEEATEEETKEETARNKR